MQTKLFFTSVLLTLSLLSTLQAQSGKYPLPEMDPNEYPVPKIGCLAAGGCHSNIEPIRAHDSAMAVEIYTKGAMLGDPNGRVVCHGGDPKEEKDANLAHKGAPAGSPLKAFNRHAASLSINDKTCGQCHAAWVWPNIGPS